MQPLSIECHQNIPEKQMAAARKIDRGLVMTDISELGGALQSAFRIKSADMADKIAKAKAIAQEIMDAK